jgi:hypothetical protein
MFNQRAPLRHREAASAAAAIQRNIKDLAPVGVDGPPAASNVPR